MVALRNSQIKNRKYGHDVIFHARYDDVFHFSQKRPEVFLFCIFVRLKQFFNARVGVGL